MHSLCRSLPLAGLIVLATAAAQAAQSGAAAAAAVTIQMIQIPAEATAMPGAPLRYVIAYTNNTAAPINGAVITTPLSPATQFLVASQGVVPAAGALTWDLPAAGPGQSGSVAFIVSIGAAAAAGTTIDAQATVSVPSLGLTLPSNTVTTTVAPPMSLSGQVKLNGSTTLLNDTQIRLVPNQSWLHGSAWLVDRQAVANGFQSLFQFRITDPGGIQDAAGANGGDGVTFVIQNYREDALGGTGGNVGYGGIPNSLAIEFDVWENVHPDLTVPDLPNEISVHTRGTQPNSPDEAYSLGRATAIPNMKDGRPHLVSILYQPGLLQVFLDQFVAPALVVKVDLSKLLSLDHGKAWVGFTASTGDAWANHDILAWQFSSY